MTIPGDVTAALQGDPDAMAAWGISDPGPEDGAGEWSVAALVRDRQAQLVHVIAAEGDRLVGGADPTQPYPTDPSLVTDES